MKKSKKKKADQLTDSEVMKVLFPKEVRKAMRKLAEKARKQ